MGGGIILVLELLFIFFARIIDVSLGTIRMIFVIRGDKWPAAAVGFIEILVYTLALALVVGALGDPIKLIVFSIGFSLGVVVGVVIEERLALGYRGLQVTIDKEHGYITDELREEGFPVTCWEGRGKAGEKLVMNIIVKRNLAPFVAEKVYEKAPSAFVVFMEPKQFRGGYFKK
ncbi:hypothetical protein SYNTR_0336 [Candidatus Syntrophocurvum alkaliphilum]|uniref:UPF0316 protein SYNTR_0336 n=1 Tax=Candidatus Syntrophocurvum alkaliphilum TaxID=2293317 RepID=A0A6I6DH22_9FIRM|nr:DUF5698 domain-containing protein [Candidatus Syntrophocurvum alkaliphilum]QGT98929.1 hypothetical protein SYNTR_0336 [Candidatus Syntrophocurvum alkaliphilum]